ncbi:DUF2489 domain-containing protein [Marinobacter sp. CA1]|uniref:DUF2489 domain-containing protein n=1 Tax=Marinobacter sp. CA1 TaxID=2817656 RepID=UPI001D0790E6|nr:DUF2489 domain-containing protein [Marinobacter sp. CA1]UDL04619.1 DUF2489 domain-containing protein [Marinobacter sp. CA1]
MPAWLQWSLIVAGLIASVLLVLFIVRQWRILRQARVRERSQAAFHAQRRENIVDSLQVLAMAIEQDQVEYSEACLRIKGLLELVAPELLTQPPYQVFQEVHDQISHMPTHQARQDTDRKFVRKMDKERFAVEQQHADAIRRAATALRQHTF